MDPQREAPTSVALLLPGMLRMTAGHNDRDSPMPGLLCSIKAWDTGVSAA